MLHERASQQGTQAPHGFSGTLVAIIGSHAYCLCRSSTISLYFLSTPDTAARSYSFIIFTLSEWSFIPTNVWLFIVVCHVIKLILLVKSKTNCTWCRWHAQPRSCPQVLVCVDTCSSFLTRWPLTVCLLVCLLCTQPVLNMARQSSLDQILTISCSITCWTIMVQNFVHHSESK